MEAKSSVLILAAALVAATTMVGSSLAYDFYVGGRQGWVQNPSESYNTWAGRNRFQVNDRLVFRYKKGEDSVLVVNEGDYGACNTGNPIRKLDGGDSVFQFDRSGPFFFISGAPGRCQGGQKLLVVVLAVRGGPRSAAPSPTPVATPSPLPSPSAAPQPSPSAGPSPSPSGAPSPSPSKSQPSPAPSPSTSPSISPPSPAAAGGPGTAAPAGGGPSSELPPSARQQAPPSGSSPLRLSIGTAALALAGAALLSL